MSGSRDVIVLMVAASLMVGTVVGETLIADLRRGRDAQPTTIIEEDLGSAIEQFANATGQQPSPPAFSSGPTEGDNPATNGTQPAAPATTAPPRDSDQDRIPDARDRCPTRPETYNGFQDQDGCPDVVTRTRAS